MDMNNFFTETIADADPLISRAIDDEVRRQANGLELIASENFVSEAVLETMGTVFTNKYAEGYPAKRYYGGCETAFWCRTRQRPAPQRRPGKYVSACYCS